MCRPTTCKTCGKTTWAGCGQHVAQVRASVPATDWCPGAARLVHLPLAPGRDDVTPIAGSSEAPARVLARLDADDRAQLVIAGLLAWRPDRTYGVWHDRAVLHFLTEPAQRAAYAALAA